MNDQVLSGGHDRASFLDEAIRFCNIDKIRQPV